MFWKKDKNKKRLSNAEACMQCDDHNEAMELLTEVIESAEASNEQKAHAYFFLAQCKSWLAHQLDEEVDSDFDPENVDEEDEIIELTEQEKAGVRSAIEDLDSALAIEAIPQKLKLEILSMRMKKNAMLEDYNSAINDCETILSLKNIPLSEYTSAMFHKADFYSRTGKIDEAIACYSKLLTEETSTVPMLIRSLMKRAELYSEIERREEAKTDYKRVLDITQEQNSPFFDGITETVLERISELG